MRVRALLRNAVAALLTVLNPWVPKGRRILLAGHPPEEPGVMEIARQLSQLGLADRVVWLDKPTADFLGRCGFSGHHEIKNVTEWSWGGAWAFLRSEVVYTSHGIYGCPRPSSGQTVVNLWHGEQAKGGGGFFPDRWQILGAPASTLVGGSTALAGVKAERCSLPPERIWLLGNPSNDALKRPAGPSRLAAVGLADRPFVLWMPTFRMARNAKGGLAWSNTVDSGPSEELRRLAAVLTVRLSNAGLLLVIKPHPADLHAYDVPGARVLSNESLRAAALPLYEVLGAASGLVSDYSSVWIDYLGCDRPVGILAPDLEAFEAGRGVFEPAVREASAGLRLADEAGVGRFVDDVVLGGGGDARLRARTILGLVEVDGQAAARVVQRSLRLPV